MKSGNLNFLEPSGPSRPVTGLLYLYLYKVTGTAHFVWVYNIQTIVTS